MNQFNPKSRINQLRRLIHVHSVIYYHLNTSIVTDAQFDGWTKELLELQGVYPELAKKGYRQDLFEDWNGNTGMHFPVTDALVILCEELIAGHQAREEAKNNGGP